jgi:hypothetical protein
MAHGPQEFIALPVELNKRQLFPRFCRCIAWHILAYALIIGFGVLFLSGCALPLAALGSASTGAASAVGGTVATAAVANPSTAVSVASTVTTGKSPLEHAASEATKKECNFLNLLGPKPVCQEFVLPKIMDHSQEMIGIADRPAPAPIPAPTR